MLSAAPSIFIHPPEPNAARGIGTQKASSYKQGLGQTSKAFSRPQTASVVRFDTYNSKGAIVNEPEAAHAPPPAPEPETLHTVKIQEPEIQHGPLFNEGERQLMAKVLDAEGPPQPKVPDASLHFSSLDARELDIPHTPVMLDPKMQFSSLDARELDVQRTPITLDTKVQFCSLDIIGPEAPRVPVITDVAVHFSSLDLKV